MFSSVVLPEPELPTMATRSPARRRRSTSSSTLRLCGPTAYSLPSLRHSRTRSVITQCLRRLGTRCPPGRIERCKEAHAQRGAADDDDVRPDQLGRQITDEVHIGTEKLGPEQ